MNSDGMDEDEDDGSDDMEQKVTAVYGKGLCSVICHYHFYTHEMLFSPLFSYFGTVGLVLSLHFPVKHPSQACVTPSFPAFSAQPSSSLQQEFKFEFFCACLQCNKWK